MKQLKKIKSCSVCSLELPNTKEFFYTCKGKLHSRCKKCSVQRMLNKQKNGTYNSYRAAMERCRNPRHNTYKDYGGRGIEFKINSWEEVRNSIGERPKGYSLDRINCNGHYEIGNIRWATSKQQARNTRRTVLTEEIVKKIRLLIRRGWPQVQICTYLSLGSGLVSNVVQGACWNDE